MIARVVDVILLLVLVEGAALTIYHRRTGKGIALPPLVANLSAGFCLMLAVRLAVSPSPEGAIAACLLGALVAHCLDLMSRWQRHD